MSSLTGFVNPAWACGCGALVANDPVRVDGEASIVQWDGSTEQIVMRLTVDSQVPNAAWIFPTPSVAKVSLGDQQWFTQIDALTKPAVQVKRDWWPPWNLGIGGAETGAPAGGPVRVLGEQRLGSLVVATLDAADAGALSAWLSTNGYNLRPELAQSLDVYVKARWKYVAVKLAPQTDKTLHGHLDPLRLSFASTRLVYPMSLSRLSTSSQHVRLWVVAPHRVQRADPDAGRIIAAVRFAGPVPDVGGSLGKFIGSGQWLTEFDTRIYRPDQITSDWQFTYAADRRHREVDVRVEPVYILGVPGGWLLVGLGVVGLAVLVGPFIVAFFRRTFSVPGIN